MCNGQPHVTLPTDHVFELPEHLYEQSYIVPKGQNKYWLKFKLLLSLSDSFKVKPLPPFELALIDFEMTKESLHDRFREHLQGTAKWWKLLCQISLALAGDIQVTWLTGYSSESL